METLDLGNDIDKIFDEFKKSVNQINSSVQNISNTTNRLTLEIKKGQEISAKHQVPLRKHELVLNSAKHMINICADFEMSRQNDVLNGTDLSAGNSVNGETQAMQKIWGNQSQNGDETNFEEFKSMVELRTDQLEKEVCKLNSLQDIIKEIKNIEY